MKKAILFTFLFTFLSPAFAIEQNFKIENNLDINKLNIEEDKYVEVINSIVEDVMENGIYFTTGEKKILMDGVNYKYQVQDVNAFLKKEVFRRNVEKAKVFKSKALLYQAMLRSKNIDSNGNAWISHGWAASKTCFTFTLLNKNKQPMGDSADFLIKRMFTIYDFVENDLISGGYIPYDPNTLQKLINDPKDILLAEGDFYERVSLEQLAQIGEISLKAFLCR